MKNSEIVNSLMFDYDHITANELQEMCSSLPRKIIRWLGSHHPDNRVRKIFFRLTGVIIGEDTVINTNFTVSDGYQPLLSIGKRVAISPGVSIIWQSNPNNSQLVNNDYVEEKLSCTMPVIILDDVWIGTNAVILPGTTIGEASIVGAGAVVTRDVAAKTVVAGVPAKIIRKLKL